MEDIGRRERKKQQTAASISDAALYLVWENSLEDVTIERISERADITSRTFFNHFGSKEEALLAIPKTPRMPSSFPGLPPGDTAFDRARLLVRTLLIEPDPGGPERLRMRRAVLARHPRLIPHELGHFAKVGTMLAPAIEEAIHDEGLVLSQPDRARRAKAILQILGAAYQLAVDEWSTDPTTGDDELSYHFDSAVSLLAHVTQTHNG